MGLKLMDSIPCDLRIGALPERFDFNIDGYPFDIVKASPRLSDQKLILAAHSDQRLSGIM